MKESIYSQIPAALPDELVSLLAHRGPVRIERIVSDGHASPEGFWYDQKEDEWVLLLSGAATLALETDGETEQVDLMPGDHLLIPARQRHRVECTSRTEKTIWLAVFFSSETA